MQQTLLALILFLSSIIASNAQNNVCQTENLFLVSTANYKATINSVQNQQPMDATVKLLVENQWLTLEIKF